VGAVARLILDGGVLPGIEMDDVIGGGEIEARASGPQADQEQVAVPRLKCRHPLFAVRGRGPAVQILMVDSACDKRLAHAF
jgi:hypothetical protein